MYKWSFYNRFCSGISDANIFLINLLRRKYFILDEQLAVKLNQNTKNPDAILKLHPDLFKALVNEKFIIPDDENELASCISYLDTKFFNNNFVRITVNPTLDCNLRCWYCYEKHFKGSVMKDAVISALLKHIYSLVNEDTVSFFQLAFFGGEPLLKFKSVVAPLMEQTYVVCKEARKKLTFNFTSNGVCLTKRVIDYLKKFDCETSIQIALDGDKNEHNKTKRQSNGRGTYHIVIDNLKYAIESGLKVSVRCNYTARNIASFKNVINDFHEYWSCRNLRFSFHKVWQEPDSPHLFMEINKLRNYIIDKGIPSSVNSYLGDSRYNCYADFDKNLVINFNGDVFKCTARNFNDDFKIGHLNYDGSIAFNENYKKRISSRFTKECFTCKLLPICKVCSQLRTESVDSCPSPDFKKNAEINIKKYLLDIINS